MDQQGITHGIRKNQVNCTRIADLLRKNYPDITFVSARVQGTRLLLTIQEENLTEDIQQTNSPCNLISDLDGKIVNMVIRNGTPLVKTGDICKQGDILVSGEVPILNDSQEVVRVEYVPADADIYVRHQIAYYQEVPLSYEKKVQSGTSKTAGIFVLVTSFLAQIQGKKIQIYNLNGRNPLETYREFRPSFFPGKNHPNTL